MQVSNCYVKPIYTDLNSFCIEQVSNCSVTTTIFQQNLKKMNIDSVVSLMLINVFLGFSFEVYFKSQQKESPYYKTNKLQLMILSKNRLFRKATIRSKKKTSPQHNGYFFLTISIKAKLMLITTAIVMLFQNPT